MARPKKTVDIFVDPKLGPTQRKQLGEVAINYIRERTAKGLGKDKKPFEQTGPYSGGRKNKRQYADNYIEHADFKTAGKSKAPINLELTGDMLDSLEVVDVSLSGRVTIGYKSAGAESDKAWFNEEKGYRFLDLSENEVNGIESSLGRVAVEDEAISDVAQSIAERLLAGITNGNR